MICWLHKSFISRLFSLFLITTYSTTSFAVIIVDIDSSQENINWIANDYFSPSDGRDIRANHSIRVVTFDTDQQKILDIKYLLASDSRSSYRANLDSCDIEYGGITADNRLIPRITPKQGFKGWIRSSGRFTCNSENLDGWDKTRPMWSIVRQTETPADLNLDAIRVYINQSDLEENLRKANPKLETPHWKTGHKKSIVVSFYTHRTFYRRDCFYYSSAKRKDPRSIFSIHETGRIGEIACDLTMMALGFIKLSGKYYGNFGIDGLYEKGDLLVAAEAKFHGSPPNLGAIVRDHLKPKFSMRDKGALGMLEKNQKDIYAKIERAHCLSQLHLLPYGILNDGKSYCRMSEDPYSIPDLQSTSVKTEVKEEHPATPLKSLNLSPIPLTPGSTEQDRGVYLVGFLRDYVRATGLTPQQVLAEMTGVISAPTFLSAEASATVQNFSPVGRLSFEHSGGGQGTPFASPERAGHERISLSLDLETKYKNLFNDLKGEQRKAKDFDPLLAELLGVKSYRIGKIRNGTDKGVSDIHEKLSNRLLFEQLFINFPITETKKEEYRRLFGFV